jgi:hypothetical protein
MDILKLQDGEFIGYYLNINWDDVIDQCNKSAVPLPTFKNTPAEQTQWEDDPTYNEMFSMWTENNFNPDSIKWRSYRCNMHFDESVADSVASYLGLTTVHSCWISRVDPGFFAPLHCDPLIAKKTDPDKGEVKRYLITISPAEAGQIFILGKDHLYNLPVGTVIKWRDPGELHIGINGSMKSKYQFHILGY